MRTMWQCSSIRTEMMQMLKKNRDDVKATKLILETFSKAMGLGIDFEKRSAHDVITLILRCLNLSSEPEVLFHVAT